MATINGTNYDLQDLDLLNLGHILRDELLKSPDHQVLMELSGREEVQFALEELTLDASVFFPAETMAGTIQQAVDAAHEEHGEVVWLESCYEHGQFLLSGKFFS